MNGQQPTLQGETRPEHYWRIASMLAFVVLAVFMVVHFGDAETTRPLVYDKGTYLGPEQAGLTDQDLGDIRYRMRSQGF